MIGVENGGGGVGGPQKVQVLQRHRGQCDVACFAKHHRSHVAWEESSRECGEHAAPS